MTKKRRIEVEIRVGRLALAAILEFDGQNKCVRCCFAVYIGLFCKITFATLEEALAYLADLVRLEFEEFARREFLVLDRSGTPESYDQLEDAKTRVQEVLAPFSEDNPRVLDESLEYFSEFYRIEKLRIADPKPPIQTPDPFNH